MPAELQDEFNHAFTNDLPQFRQNQIAPSLSLVMLAEVAVFGGIGITLWGAGKVLAKIIRQFQRPQYYPQERERRQRLAKERRSIRKRYTINDAPTGEELLAQWAKVRKNPREMIRFGSMLCDIEAYVDNSLTRNEYGEIVGRQPGIRGWLAKNCPLLHSKYKTIMRYKAMAEKFRQAFGLTDPYPAALLLDEDENNVPNAVENKAGNQDFSERKENENMVRKVSNGETINNAKSRKTKRRRINGKLVKEIGEEEWEKMRGEVRKMLEGCKKTERGLMVGLGTRINPDAVPRAIEIRERRQQGLPERDGLLRRFTKEMA